MKPTTSALLLLSATNLALASVNPQHTCGSLGVNFGRMMFDQQDPLSVESIDLERAVDHKSAVTLKWNNNGLNQLLPGYQVLLSRDNGTTFEVDLGMVKSGRENIASAEVPISASVICPRPCCRALTAECLSCTANMSEEQYCSYYPDTVGCGDSTENTFCCQAMVASCLACKDGVTIPEYCSKNRDTEGCDGRGVEDVEEEDEAALVSASADADSRVDTSAICCKAMTAECLSCSVDLTVIEYCTKFPQTVGCGYVFFTKLMLKSRIVLGCAYSTVAEETLVIRCPTEYGDPADPFVLTEPIKIGLAVGATALVMSAGFTVLYRRKTFDEMAGDEDTKSRMSFPSQASAQAYAEQHDNELEEVLQHERDAKKAGKLAAGNPMFDEL